MTNGRKHGDSMPSLPSKKQGNITTVYMNMPPMKEIDAIFAISYGPQIINLGADV